MQQAQLPRHAVRPAPEAHLRAQNVVKDYRIGRRTLRVLHGVNVEVRGRELLSIVGPSGAGKSTLLHILGMLDTPTEGKLLHRGRNLAELSPLKRADMRNRLFGFVFQFYHLLGDFTARENVALPALAQTGDGAWRRHSRDTTSRAMFLLETVGLADRAEHRPAQLSGGERQRVAIARALINEPEILFCDEPTGNLDSGAGQAVLDLLHGVRDNTGCAMVIVTHDEKIASACERAVRLVDGRITD
ncbi:MAG: ABC transporter ATP-binding protein [Planctomycetes bacterium]|nr:ABC transporter ATP-binding protein [Planctomycetota bacterium]